MPGEWFPFVILAAAIIGSFGFCIYTVLGEYRTGQTLGKRMAGLQVVRESGAPIGFGQAIVRLLPVTLQIYWIDVLFALFTDKRQRAFEMLSKTRVVRAGNGRPAVARVMLATRSRSPGPFRHPAATRPRRPSPPAW